MADTTDTAIQDSSIDTTATTAPAQIPVAEVPVPAKSNSVTYIVIFVVIAVVGVWAFLKKKGKK